MSAHPSAADAAERLAARCRAVLPLAGRKPDARFGYDALPLAVIEAVWSVGVRYEQARRVAATYAAYAALPDPKSPLPAPAVPTLSGLLATVEALGVERFAEEVLRNRQRTTAKNGILKAEAVYRVAAILREHGVETVEDVRRLSDPPAFAPAVLAVPGQTGGASLRTLYRLCDAEALVRPGATLCRFLETATGAAVAPDDAPVLLASACPLLAREAPGLTPHRLGQIIWQYERSGGSFAPSPTPAVAPRPVPAPAVARTEAETKPKRVPKVPPVAAIPPAVPPPPATPVAPATPEAEATDGATALDGPERYSVRIRELPADERPRERLLQQGPEVLSVTELLAILLRTGTEQRSAVNLAEHLLSEHGGLRGVAALSVEEMAKVHGLGPAKAAQIKAAIEFGRRLVAASPEERPRIKCPQDVYNLLGPSLRDEKRENFVALLMDTKNGVMRQRTVSIGDLSSAIVHPREVFLEAVRHSAASLIVAHNHPSGDPTPSPEDIQITRRLAEAGELLGIEVLDHVVIGDSRWYSLKEKGHL